MTWQERHRALLERIYADPVLAEEYEADLAIQSAKENGPEQEEPDYEEDR